MLLFFAYFTASAVPEGCRRCDDTPSRFATFARHDADVVIEVTLPLMARSDETRVTSNVILRRARILSALRR